MRCSRGGDRTPCRELLAMGRRRLGRRRIHMMRDRTRREAQPTRAVSALARGSGATNTQPLRSPLRGTFSIQLLLVTTVNAAVFRCPQAGFVSCRWFSLSSSAPASRSNTRAGRQVVRFSREHRREGRPVVPVLRRNHFGLAPLVVGVGNYRIPFFARGRERSIVGVPVAASVLQHLVRVAEIGVRIPCVERWVEAVLCEQVRSDGSTTSCLRIRRGLALALALVLLLSLRSSVRILNMSPNSSTCSNTKSFFARSFFALPVTAFLTVTARGSPQPRDVRVERRSGLRVVVRKVQRVAVVGQVDTRRLRQGHARGGVAAVVRGGVLRQLRHVLRRRGIVVQVPTRCMSRGVPRRPVSTRPGPKIRVLKGRLMCRGRGSRFVAGYQRGREKLLVGVLETPRADPVRIAGNEFSASAFWHGLRSLQCSVRVGVLGGAIERRVQGGFFARLHARTFSAAFRLRGRSRRLGCSRAFAWCRSTRRIVRRRRWRNHCFRRLQLGYGRADPRTPSTLLAPKALLPSTLTSGSE
mmetsp:Transcript_5332/g.13476  ORF Transcript_5332/g.13476 Transcript_5332/m.13476 type:complete len:526 (+) Transcript_5332:1772-3349(+)